MHQHHIAHPNAPLVLYGVGGVGKTQLAREYVHRYADLYAVVWWVPAEPAEEARKSLVSLAERLGVPLRESAEQTISGVLSELESRRVRFLLADLRRTLGPEHPIVADVALGNRIDCDVEPPSL
jgi:DNA transposition AAA+ family ATPase